MRHFATAFALILCLTPSAQVAAQRTVPTCADLAWSAQVRADNPDITEACQGVYQRGDEYFAKISIEVTRASGNHISFRPRHVDGRLGAVRTIAVPGSWRAQIDGREYRAEDLLPGQELNVYIPEERFALAVESDEGIPEEAALVAIEEEVVEMPTTASPLFLVGAIGGGFLALGGLLTGLRRRRS